MFIKNLGVVFGKISVWPKFKRGWGGWIEPF